MNEKSTQILELVKDLTILELADLVKALEEEFGVSAAPVAVAAAPGAAAAAPVEEKTEFDVVLKGAGANKLAVIKVVSACCLKNNVELGLLLNGSCCCSAGSCCYCYGSCGYAELLLECLYEICEFKNSKTLYKFKDLSGLFVHFIILQIYYKLLISSN